MFRFIHILRAKWHKVRSIQALEKAEQSRYELTDEWNYWIDKYKFHQDKHYAIVKKHKLTSEEL